MFFLPAAIFAGVEGIGWGDALHNWLFAFLGNLVGAAVFVSGAYWFIYGRDDDEEAGDTPAGATAGAGNGRPASREAEPAGAERG